MHECRELFPSSRPRLGGLQSDIFVRSGIGEPLDQVETRLADAGPYPVYKSQLPDRCEDRALGEQLLHLLQDYRTPLVVHFGRLLLEHSVDLGIAAICIDAALDGHGLEAGRGIAKGAGPALNDVLKRLLAIALEESRALQRSQFGADTNRPEVVAHRLGEVRIRRVAIILTSVKTL